MYQDVVNNNVNQVPSHMVINEYIRKHGCDYRFEVDENPIKLLRDRRCDNTCVGRYPMKKCELMLKKNWIITRINRIKMANGLTFL